MNQQNDIWSIYSETVRDHALNPRSVGALADADGYGRKSEDCGDTMEIWIKVVQGTITEASFFTDACAATVACGSMTVTLARGRTLAGAQWISPAEVIQALGGLPEGNQHCAVLAVSVLRAALRDYVELQRDPWKKAYRKYGRT